MNEEIKKEISFLDANNNRFKVKVEITHRNGYPEFTASAEWGSGCGQCLDKIKPRTEAQRNLVKLWEEWHLNGKDKKLPDEFKATLIKLCDTIMFEEKKRKEAIKKTCWDEQKIVDDDKVRALAEFLDLSPEEAEELIINERGNDYTAEGTEYFVGTEEEVHDEATEYLTDDTDIYVCWVETQIKEKNAGDIVNIHEWAQDVIDTDGYGSILNSWDGTEETIVVNGTTYYIIRKG